MEQMIFKVLQYRSWITRWRLACKRYLWRCQLRLKVDQRSHRSRLQSLEAKVGKLENKLHSNQCRTPHPILPQTSYHQSRTLPLQMTILTQKPSPLLKMKLNLKSSLSRSKLTNCSSRRTNYAKSLSKGSLPKPSSGKTGPLRKQSNSTNYATSLSSTHRSRKMQSSTIKSGRESNNWKSDMRDVDNSIVYTQGLTYSYTS